MSSGEKGSVGRASSPLWNRALERYRDELSENETFDDIINEAASLQDVLDYTRTFEAYLPRERSTLVSFNRLGPMLKFVDDFSAVIALCFGADTRLTAFVWGSIRLILSLAVAASVNLQSIIDMLEEVSLTLPEIRSYEEDFPMTKALESSLLDLYTEIICFYARTISFFKNNPNITLQKKAWGDFQVDFSRTLKRIRRMSSKIKSEADIARMSMDKSRYQEVLDLVQDFKESKLADETSSHKVFLLPHDPEPRFSGREEALEAVSKALDPAKHSRSLRTFALYGMGGVGKTQVALQYAKQSRDLYDVFIWIGAETSHSIGQASRDSAQALKLIQSEEELKDTNAAILKLRNWLRDTKCCWLMILDNADDVDIVKQIWPIAAQGSILLTSRDFSAANQPASSGYHVKPFDDEVGARTLLNLLAYDENSVANKIHALEITKMIGGLPLAINQVASFISQRRLPLKDFPCLYERNSAKIDSRKSRLTLYEHTLSTVWELSLSRLSGNAAHLQNLVAFLDPDVIDGKMLAHGASRISDPDFEFLLDEMEFGDAEEMLLQAALMDKSISHQVLSVHRLVQAAVIRRIPSFERAKYLDAAIELLAPILVDTWSQDTKYELKAWTKQVWIQHERCLPHITNLVKQMKMHGIQTQRRQKLGELLISCVGYLKEREYYDTAHEFINIAQDAIEDKESLQYARAVNMAGLIALNLNEPFAAVEPFKKALSIREKLLRSDDSFIAWGYNNLGLAYTELGKRSEALDSHKMAMEARLRNDTGLIGNSYSNLSSLYLQMGNPNEAEEYLFKCPSLKDCTDDTFLSKNNPRFAGDMVLLSRIRRAQGRRSDALRLASKALAYRKKLLGNRFAVCDSMYDVADLLSGDGNQGTALSILQELVSIAEGLPGSHSHAQLARANYKLAIIYQEIGRKAESEACKGRALDARFICRPNETNPPFVEESFSKLCPWMLW